MYYNITIMHITKPVALFIKTELNTVVFGVKKRVTIVSIFEKAKIDFNKILKKKNIGLVKKLIEDIHFGCFKHKIELSVLEYDLLKKAVKKAYYNYSSGGKKFKTNTLQYLNGYIGEEPPILEPEDENKNRDTTEERFVLDFDE